ncbi:hypothetical protein BDY19DRAFT_908382 [Irpex rosettiformis]|uniref:Uncharacterized protein n=1 Tax=Irpex rosettiformis TaxID=378272 RepID=A0ACB8TWT0_9APHY|nr:hypothetical protein BDY19DRAFT_908382 [Irpex rosettiformis]
MAFYASKYRPPFESRSTQNRIILPRVEPPCVAFSPYFPPERVVPPHGHKRSRSIYCRPLHPTPPSTVDLMQTVDLRFSGYTPNRRSSFDLSDILEEDEAEIDIDDILPPSPTLEQCSASTLTARSTRTLERVGRKLKDVLRGVGLTSSVYSFIRILPAFAWFGKVFAKRIILLSCHSFRIRICSDYPQILLTPTLTTQPSTH